MYGLLSCRRRAMANPTSSANPVIKLKFARQPNC
ncbi:Uncharacterised protein [Vibrio cholerae]|nr:Uncharacterised protein [Vibrio cholerae]